MSRLIVLSDYGLDDAVALCHLLDNRRWDFIDVVCVAGNTSAATSLRNASKLLASYEGNRQGIVLVDTTQIPQPFEVLEEVHGFDGMGDILPDADSPVPIIAWNNYLKNTHENVEYIVSLGAATLAIPLKQKYPSTPLLLMGHVVEEKPNHKGMEFNYYLDIEAFEQCMEYPDAVVASLDTCRAPVFNYAVNAPPPTQTLFYALLKRSIQLAVARHSDNAYIYDFIAIKYLTNPQIFGKKIVTTKNGKKMTQLFAK